MIASWPSRWRSREMWDWTVLSAEFGSSSPQIAHARVSIPMAWLALSNRAARTIRALCPPTAIRPSGPRTSRGPSISSSRSLFKFYLLLAVDSLDRTGARGLRPVAGGLQVG